MEIEYLTDIFCKNRHDRKTLQKIINSFEKKTPSTNKNNNSNTDKKQTITFTWIQKIRPKIRPKIKKEVQKFGFRLAFQMGPNLRIFYAKIKIS